MASSDPKKHGRIHKLFGSVSASVWAGRVTFCLQSVSANGWAAAAASLDLATGGAVLATTAVLGISHACEGKAERKKAGDLAKEFTKLSNQQGKALDLLDKIAEGEIGIELSWIGREEVAERTTAMLSGKLDELEASVLESIEKGLAAVAARVEQDNSTNVAVGDGGIGRAEQTGGPAPAFQGGVHHHHYPGTAPAPERAEVTQEPTRTPRDPNISIAHLPNTGPYLFGRDAMLALLDDAWNDNQTNVFALVAGGGVGKSALVNHWLAAMGQDGYRGARRGYGHSCYSQGPSAGTASADAFFAEALAWFGDPDPTKGTAWARGERLAELVRKERTLLILDGMEPLQFPPGPNAGRVTDPGLQALLRELAARSPGLCVVTTREHVVDLDRFAGAGAAQKNLEDLPNEAGAELLKELGVDGSPKERAKASEEFGNHALALTLLGTYLVKACGGDIRRRTEISLVDADKVHGGHARKVMASYEKWFTEHDRNAELLILRMLGLFNRPAEAGCIAALRDGEPITDLTTGLAGISAADWNIARSNLREAGLLARPDVDTPGTLDAHPLVREHFGARLNKEYPESWKAGHERLYEYLKGPGCEKDLPDTAEEMAPLFAAVLHGCAAGRHQEVLDEVYVRRIRREGDQFSVNKLGLWGTDLGALAGLFEEPWRPAAVLSKAAQAFILNEAGMGLIALGRLTEGVEPMQDGLERHIAQENWINAGRAAGTVSEFCLTLGRIPEAIDTAKRSVDFAERSRNVLERRSKQTTLADALHQAGRASDAQALFQDAERMQKDFQPAAPLLYSLWGYRYCDLLLARGDSQGVIERATSTIEIAKHYRWLLSIALDHLSLGRAHLLGARVEGADAYKKAWAYLDLAVDGLRESGHQVEIPRGLLARAELYLFTGDLDDARADLNEAMDIATRDPAGLMKLFVTDCHLGYARLALKQGGRDAARENLDAAKGLIDETGYHRRDEELADLEAQWQA